MYDIARDSCFYTIEHFGSNGGSVSSTLKHSQPRGLREGLCSTAVRTAGLLPRKPEQQGSVWKTPVVCLGSASASYVLGPPTGFPISTPTFLRFDGSSPGTIDNNIQEIAGCGVPGAKSPAAVDWNRTPWNFMNVLRRSLLLSMTRRYHDDEVLPDVDMGVSESWRYLIWGSL